MMLDDTRGREITATGKQILEDLFQQMFHPIPALDSPYSRIGWPQPDRMRIEVDDTHALMYRRDFETLAEYSHSFPSGVYVGKMWKRHGGAELQDETWLLCWYGIHEDPKRCTIEHRKILLVD